MNTKPSNLKIEEIVKEHYKDELVSVYEKLDLLMKRIEWQDADGISTGIGHSSADEIVARESIRDMNKTSEERYNIDIQDCHQNIKYISQKIMDEGGTESDISECRERATQKNTDRASRILEISKKLKNNK